MKQARDFLIELYFNWRNNYLTIAKFAEHNGLTEDQATQLIALADNVCATSHPEE